MIIPILIIIAFSTKGISLYLAKVIMIDEDNNEYDILFSKVVGEQATYKMKSGNIEAFGADKNKYLDSLKKDEK